MAPERAPRAPVLSVVLPSYQEARNLEVLLPRLRETLSSLVATWEILVVDTSAPLDDTFEVCQAEGVRHLRRQGGNNYGDALRTGLAGSRGERVVTMDADGSHDPGFIRTLWDHREDADVVIASRYVAGGATKNPWLLVALSRVLNAVFSIALGIRVRDVSNGFRLYRGDQVRSITLASRHFDVLEEILGRLLWELRPPATLAELPFRFQPRHCGNSKRSPVVLAMAFLGALVRLRRLRRSLSKARAT